MCWWDSISSPLETWCIEISLSIASSLTCYTNRHHKVSRSYNNLSGRCQIYGLWGTCLRTLLFAGGKGLANSTFSHVGGFGWFIHRTWCRRPTKARKPKAFKELLSTYGKAKPITISIAVNNIVQLQRMILYWSKSRGRFIFSQLNHPVRHGHWTFKRGCYFHLELVPNNKHHLL